MTSSLSAREVCQRLREAALGVLAIKRNTSPCDGGLVAIDIEGWHLLLDVEGGHLRHCIECRTPAGLEWMLDSSQHFGTDPISLLSTWELAQMDRWLAGTDG